MVKTSNESWNNLYKAKTVELIDELIQNNKLNRIAGGFKNAAHLLNNQPDNTDEYGRGYWELVYCSIQSMLDQDADTERAIEDQHDDALEYNDSITYIENHPILDASQARKILEDHGFNSIPENLYFTSKHVGDGRYWVTQDVFNWLGY